MKIIDDIDELRRKAMVFDRLSDILNRGAEVGREIPDAELPVELEKWIALGLLTGRETIKNPLVEAARPSTSTKVHTAPERENAQKGVRR